MAEVDKPDDMVEVIEELRLPCGHTIPLPITKSSHMQCRWDQRKWHITNKTGEWLAREEY